ncbi:hypothetical protein FFI89_013745 [Bradyrhizobium sp. KBS0727]|nr:hypothetical protein FFI71_013740 [Bradyrhizobium sp. KBS0725]QDW44718.1 hypothetical protein FFI89_013745 [Bradyrhizobium sp. KBS0727]
MHDRPLRQYRPLDELRSACRPVDTCRRPNDVDLTALTHSPTTFVHNLGSRLRCERCAEVGIHLG